MVQLQCRRLDSGIGRAVSVLDLVLTELSALSPRAMDSGICRLYYSYGSFAPYKKQQTVWNRRDADLCMGSKGKPTSPSTSSYVLVPITFPEF